MPLERFRHFATHEVFGLMVREMNAHDLNLASLKELEGGGPTQALRELVWHNRGELAHLLK